MGKVFIVLDEKQQMMAERISIDKDSREALEFVLEVVVPQLKKKKPCSQSVHERYQGRF